MRSPALEHLTILSQSKNEATPEKTQHLGAFLNQIWVTYKSNYSKKQNV